MTDTGDSKAPDTRPVCFVVMGFGEKVAYSQDQRPRTLNLDATYAGIIEPAVTDAGLRCIRADHMLNSGMIDTRMFELLLRADLVVADISTGNVNAVYELGVRHALRPQSTIVMQEDKAAFHFDLSHISTFTYRHLGEDIGATEAKDKKEALEKLIRKTMAAPTRDSPVYEFLRGLNEPAMSEEDYQRMLTVIEEKGDGLQQAIATGKNAKKEGRLADAAEAFAKALAIITSPGRDDDETGQSERTYVTQQLALTTYKSKEPSEKEALKRGLEIIDALNPATSNDTETVGIAGAMHKRLWGLDEDRTHLDSAIDFYGRGFNVKRDYYNGENYALCLVMRAEVQDADDEAMFDRMSAQKVRADIVDLLATDFADPGIGDRTDKVWMHATMANCLFALGRDDEAQPHEDAFKELADGVDWMLDTYESGKQEVLRQRQQ